MWEKIPYTENGGEEFLGTQHSQKRPFTVELVNLFLLFNSPTCDDMLALVIAIGDTVPEQEVRIQSRCVEKLDIVEHVGFWVDIVYLRVRTQSGIFTSVGAVYELVQVCLLYTSRCV